MAEVVVQKFGGTSVSDPEMRAHAARRVAAAYHQGKKPVVVVSAMGRGGYPYATDTLINLAREIGPDIEPRELDILMACGEIISTAIMAHTVRVLYGFDTIALTGGQAGIVTDYNFGKARIIKLDPAYIRWCLERDIIPVVAGFQGVTEHGVTHVHGAITTLGRGGSDTTASAVGAALKAESVEIYTDVEGVMTADPRLVPQAFTLDWVTYEEICEMAHLGASVLHPRSAELAMQYNIPLWVKATASSARGTLVTRGTDSASRGLTVTGVTRSGHVVPISMRIEDVADKSYVEQEIYNLLAAADISIYLVCSDPRLISFVVAKDSIKPAVRLLDGAMIPAPRPGAGTVKFYALTVDPAAAVVSERRQMLERANPRFQTCPAHVEIGEDARIVSLIGRNLQRVIGIMARLAESLDRAGVRILQMADSKISLSSLVNEEESGTAVQALHAEFVGSAGTMTQGG